MATLEISEHRYCLCDKARLTSGGKCPRCDYKKLSGLYSALSYKEKPLTRKLIHAFKYPPSYVKELAVPLASIIIDHIYLLGETPKSLFKEGLLAPIPLDKKKMKQRGYNQSEELAKEISKATGAPVATNILFKIKATPAQMELGEKERRENLKDSFKCGNTECVRGKNIFLVDDVYTTGSTIEECASQLLLAGAKQVQGIVVARD